jgi:hypothetical protein
VLLLSLSSLSPHFFSTRFYLSLFSHHPIIFFHQPISYFGFYFQIQSLFSLLTIFFFFG